MVTLSRRQFLTAGRLSRATRVGAVLAAFAALVLIVPQAAAHVRPNAAEGPRSRYILRLAEPPLASYVGGIAGLAPTNPRVLGQTRLDAASPAAVAYLSHLALRQAQVRSQLALAFGRPVAVDFSYRYAFNGIAAWLTEADAAEAAGTPGVAQVQADFTRQLLTDNGPTWIGAPAIWTGTGGLPGTKGEGVVIGVIDTGVNHDHPSFADVGGDGYNHTNPRGRFLGLCDPLLGLPFCNDKLIGVWDFTGTGPEDDNGHGSHTASTSGGNVLDATINAPTMSLTRPISGVAPHANLVTYKACQEITGSCVVASLTAAIDQATADGVDVINYSIGGSSADPWTDADSQAFLGARDAGIFVSVSAGNSGPRPETIGSPADSPWVLAVGASSHDRALLNALIDMSGGSTTPPADIHGVSFTSGVGPAPIVHAADFGDRLCGAPFLPGTFDSQIVICERGVNARVDKGSNVKLGGAAGMVLANSAAEGESTVADPHVLPAVHIGFADAQVLEAWVRDGGAGHTATIAGTTVDVDPANGDVMAGFSSRGANPSVPGVVKPDITAPGVDILAAWMGLLPGPAEYNIISGTSMSSPHMAGAAALVRALHPAWTPGQVQSALMTTALSTGVRKEDGLRPADPFDMGAGRVDLSRAGRAGLLLDETVVKFTAANPAQGGDSTSLNLASLGNSECVATCTWTRTVSNALATTVTWNASTSGPRGLKLTVSPSRFTLAPGATQTITVAADVGSLPVGPWIFGQVTLSPKQGVAPTAHLPVAIKPGGEPTPVDILTNAAAGSHVVSVTSPVAITRFSSVVSGLTEGSVSEHQVLQDPTPLDPYDGLGGTFHVLTEVPPGARFLVTTITDTTATDLDLYVGLDGDGDGQPDAAEEVCASASEIALESCRLPNPEGGTYWIMVQNWLTGQVLDDVKLTAVVIPGTDNGNLTVSAPKSVPADTPFDITLSWNEPALAAGTTWFALVEFGSSPAKPNNAGSLLVRINRQ